MNKHDGVKKKKTVGLILPHAVRDLQYLAQAYLIPEFDLVRHLGCVDQLCET